MPDEDENFSGFLVLDLENYDVTSIVGSDRALLKYNAIEISSS